MKQIREGIFGLGIREYNLLSHVLEVENVQESSV